MSRDYVIPGNTPGDWSPMAIAQWTDHNGVMPSLDFDLGSDGSGVAARQDEKKRGQGKRRDKPVWSRE